MNIYSSLVPAFRGSEFTFCGQNCRHTVQDSVIGVILSYKRSTEHLQRTRPGEFLTGFTEKWVFEPGLQHKQEFIAGKSEEEHSKKCMSRDKEVRNDRKWD